VTLAAAFLSEAPGAGAASEGEAVTERRLAELVSRGRAAHPGLAVDDVVFVRHLARCARGGGAEPSQPPERLHVEDLYLACACAAGVAGAAARFEERCGPRLRAALGAAVKSPDLRAEIRQRVLDMLLVGARDEPPKVSSYGGRGPLDTWTVVVAHRQLSRHLRTDAYEQRAREGAAVEAALAPVVQPEVAFARQRYRSELERALADALLVLEERDRLLLRLQLVSRVSVENIGKMYGVAQATASRWLASARERVQGEVIRLLRERLRASPDEIASLVGMVASQIDVSISRLLGPADLVEPPPPAGRRDGPT
jgi:RNA polymerase sigma-70 factor (ECF subfamily)